MMRDFNARGIEDLILALAEKKMELQMQDYEVEPIEGSGIVLVRRKIFVPEHPEIMIRDHKIGGFLL